MIPHNHSRDLADPARLLAPLRNVALFSALLERVMSRQPHLPGLATFHGVSGTGKSYSALYATAAYHAYHVEVRSTWTRKVLCEAVLKEMGLPWQGPLNALIDRIGEHLSLSSRPLIIDEADNAVDRGMVELIRDIYESAAGAIVLIGEELLPAKLKRWERVHNRMLDWVGAEPADFDDSRHLASFYCPGLTLAEDLLRRLCAASAGSVRRICVNLNRIEEEARLDGRAAADLDWWGERPFFTGTPPARRA